MKTIEIKKFGVVTGFEVYKHNQKICDFDKNMQGFIQNFKLSKEEKTQKQNQHNY